MMTETTLAKRTAIFEISAFLTLAIASKAVLDPFIWRYSGPVSLIFTLICLLIYLGRRGEGFSSLGLRSPGGLAAKLWVFPKALLTIVGIIGTSAILVLGGDALGLEFMQEVPAGVADRWGDVEGNLPKYLMWLAIVWTSAAFGEEIFFRGFLVTRVQAIFQGNRFQTFLSILIPALLFGVAHVYYQGLRGLVTTGAVGFVLCSLYILYKRNLWPLIIAHGFVDTLMFTATYNNWDI